MSRDRETTRTGRTRVRGTEPGQHLVAGPGGLDLAAFAEWYRDRTQRQWQELDVPAISRLADVIERAADAGRTVYVMGNGGSVTTSESFAVDLSKTASSPGRPPVKCISLAGNLAFISAVANDASFEDIFSRQLENLLGEGDIVLLLSGSGNSPNLVKAALLARERKAVTAALLGFDGGRLQGLVDVPVVIPSDQYGIVEDLHLSICHLLAFYLRQRR